MLLCNQTMRTQLEDILKTDLYEDDSGFPIENDAFDKDGNPVLFSYLCDLPRIQRFDTALRLRNKSGTLICFDFQQEILARYCNKNIHLQTIDFDKWERSFFE